MVREIPDPDRRSVRERAGALDHVLKLTHVARPGMGVEARQRFGVDAIERTVAVSPVAAQEVVHEQAHVAGPLPERRQRDRDHVDAEEEVLPELALPDELRGVSVRRRHEADVHVQNRVAPTRRICRS